MSSTLAVTSWYAGRQPDQDAFNEYATVFNRMLHGIGAEVIQNVTSQPIPASATTTITFDNVVYDTDGCWDPAHPTLLTAQTPGWYWIEYRGGWPAVLGQSERTTGIAYNDVSAWGQCTYRNASESGTAHPMHSCASTSLWLNVGDYVELQLWQDSGGTINTDPTTDGGQSMMRITWRSN